MLFDQGGVPVRVKLSDVVAEADNIRGEMKADAVWVANIVAKYGYPFPESMFMPDDEVADTGGDNANPAV